MVLVDVAFGSLPISTQTVGYCIFINKNLILFLVNGSGTFDVVISTEHLFLFSFPVFLHIEVSSSEMFEIDDHGFILFGDVDKFIGLALFSRNEYLYLLFMLYREIMTFFE